MRIHTSDVPQRGACLLRLVEEASLCVALPPSTLRFLSHLRFMHPTRSSALALAIAAATTVTAVAGAQTLDSATAAGMRWRNVGPANFMGRLSDVQGIPGPSKTLFVAAAAGGIWKSTNNGQTWRPTFDDKRV